MAMKFGIMRAHQERVRNEGRIVASLPEPKRQRPEPHAKGLLAGRQLEDFLSASLAEDLAALKAITSIERKAAHKRETLLPKYAPYVQRLQAAGSGHELLGYWLVWLFDAGDIEKGLHYGLWCMEQGVPLPERFKSPVPFFLAVQVTEWAEGEWTAGREMQPYFDEVWQRALQEPEAWNLPDDLVARFHRLLGLSLEQGGDLNQSERHLDTAMRLGAKVKTALERVRKKIKTRDEGAAAPGETPGEDAAEDENPAADPSGQ